MSKFICPMSDTAISHIETLTKSYYMALEAVNEYHRAALADPKQVKNALKLADRLNQTIQCYLTGWEAGSPCLNFSCGWEYCQRNLKVLQGITALSDLPQENFSADVNISADINNRQNQND